LTLRWKCEKKGRRHEQKEETIFRSYDCEASKMECASERGLGRGLTVNKKKQWTITLRRGMKSSRTWGLELVADGGA